MYSRNYIKTWMSRNTDGFIKMLSTLYGFFMHLTIISQLRDLRQHDYIWWTAKCVEKSVYARKHHAIIWNDWEIPQISLWLTKSQTTDIPFTRQGRWSLYSVVLCIFAFAIAPKLKKIFSPVLSIILFHQFSGTPENVRNHMLNLYESGRR
jgi:hypothetical protein